MVINYSVRHKKTRLENLVFITIPAAGVEPARPCGHWILSPARLPIPPRRQIVTGVAGFEPTHEGVKVPCLTAWLYPNNIKWASDGDRTHACQSHNLVC